jgi:hypothetical protein
LSNVSSNVSSKTKAGNASAGRGVDPGGRVRVRVRVRVRECLSWKRKRSWG